MGTRGGGKEGRLTEKKGVGAKTEAHKQQTIQEGKKTAMNYAWVGGGVRPGVRLKRNDIFGTKQN